MQRSMSSSMVLTKQPHNESSFLLPHEEDEYEDRIPRTLQAVFNASNRGKLYDKAPPDRVAFKVFRRRWRKTSASASSSQFRSLWHVDKSHSAVEDWTTCDSSSVHSEEPILRMVPSRTSSGTLPLSPKKCKKQQLQLQNPSSPRSAPNTANHISPHAYVTSLLRNRGYPTQMMDATATAYHTTPTALQKASYGLFFVEAVAQNECETVRHLLRMGLSPNACNIHGESIVHMVCRLGLPDMLQILLEYGASVQVADSLGRTPCHEACSTADPCFAVVDLLLEQDSDVLFLRDQQKACPLDYLTNQQWTRWTKYLMSRKDRFWPERDIKKEGYRPLSELMTQPEQSRTIPDPTVAESIPLESIALAAKGRRTSLESLQSERGLQLSTCSDFDGDLSSTRIDDGPIIEIVANHHNSFSNSCSSKGDLEYYHEDEEEDEDDAVSAATFDEDEMAQILGKFQ